MTQYMLAVHHKPGEAPYADPDDMQRAFEQTAAFNQQLMDAGTWVFGGGLEDPSIATMVDGRGREVVVTDGPFAETKEQLGGFWVIEAPDLDAALDLAAKASAACLQPVEVRPFQAED
jgi:hypothetical protein